MTLPGSIDVALGSVQTCVSNHAGEIQMRRTQTNFHLAALRRRNELFCKVDAWGFLSVTLVLLLTFMVGTGIAPHHFAAVDLPTSVHSVRLPRAIKEDALRVFVWRDGKVYLGHSQVARGDLTEMIREGVRSGAEKKVYVSADARAKYGSVSAVLEEIRLSGIENVAFLTSSSR